MTEGGEQRRTSNAAARAPRPRSNWTASRVIGIVFASIGGLIGLALLVGGIAVLAAYAFGRDDDGYFNSDRQQLESATYAIITEDIDLGVDEVDWAPIGRWTAVVMNADAARGIDVEADAGVKLGWAIWAGLGMFVVGLLMTAGAVVVILLIGRGASRASTTG